MEWNQSCTIHCHHDGWNSHQLEDNAGNSSEQRFGQEQIPSEGNIGHPVSTIRAAAQTTRPAAMAMIRQR